MDVEQDDLFFIKEMLVEYVFMVLTTWCNDQLTEKCPLLVPSLRASTDTRHQRITYRQP